jgi:arginyl-tRNA synthetase
MFRKKVIDLLKKEVKVDVDKLLEIPPNSELGDFAFPCFILAKELKKAPNKIAEELSNKIKPTKYIVKIQNVGPYVNFFINPKEFSKYVLEEISKNKLCYGSQKKQKDKIMVEYSQPNTHKAFHVGHLRGTSLGESLSRILKHLGYNVIQANYSGDTGAHIGKWLWNYLKNHKGEWPKENIAQWIASIYVEAVKKVEENPKYQDEVNAINYKLENHLEKDLEKLWKKTKKLSIKCFNKIYKDLDAHFNEWFFESEMENPGKEIVKDMLKRGLVEISDDATIINLENYNLGIWVLLRKDGTVLYSSKDLALAKIKFQKYKIDRAVYVIGNAQSLHMRQLFKTLELMGFKQANKCYYLSIEEVRLPSGKMSSRTGVNILYEDMVENMMQHAIKETKKRHKDWGKSKLEKVAKALTISALKFDMLIQDNNKKIIFDSVKSLAFEGDTGPYLQYTYARSNSILKKAGKMDLKNVDYSAYKLSQELNLIRALNRFKEVVYRAGESYKPNLLANYTLTLAHTFNEFYHHCSCIVENKELSKARLLLVTNFKGVMALSLNLLAIPILESM